MLFIDIHCHILHGVDDGAESLDESAEIISNAFSSGTTVMVATPHYNNIFQGRHSVDKNLLSERYFQLKKFVSEKIPGMQLFLGCELRAEENLDELLRNDNYFTINGSRYVLLEFAFDEELNNAKRYVDIIRSYGLVPIIAHPERYGFLVDCYKDVENFASKGCLFQINKDSPLGKYGESAKNFSRWFLKNDMLHLFAGDCHGVTHRNADMTALYEWLINYYPVTKINTWLHDNPKRILLDMKI